MAKVPLRKYNSEIESLIERGQLDEAVAHCRHILKTFPKHLETYRLLGKAYLEAKRHSDAADLFNRILMAVPDDFVAHAGLSIIADEQRRLDDAIWHMERAFEKQPSNAAIQAELQRLYGRRDGHEPPKIRLTRGALAHMYFQGELFTQAINEIRSVLNEDPTRTDLKTLLALTYFRAGQKVDATETCSQILSQFPYSLDANRILIEILPGTSMAESVGTYRQRVIELDPYAAFARSSIFHLEDAPDSAVTLETLEYNGQPVEASPDWSQSLAIGLEPAAPVSAEPEWLKAAQTAEPASSSSIDPFGGNFSTPLSTPEPAAPAPADSLPFGTDLPPAAAKQEEDIPEWMRQAGWGASTGAFDESASAFAEPAAPAESELEKADLPDWIKSMAPAQPAEPAPTPASSVEDQETLDWIKKLDSDNALAASGENPFDNPPLSEAPLSQPAEDLFASAAASEPATAVPADLPDWLSSLDQPSEPSASAEPASAPDWLSGATGAGTAAAAAADWLSKLDDVSSEAAPASTSPVEEVPDWLSNMESASEPAAAPADDLPDWLANTKQPAEPAPTPAAETNDWLKDFQPLPAQQPEPALPQQPPAPSAAGGIGSLGASADEQDAALLWLESLAAKQGANPEELITDPNARLEKPPEWVEQAKSALEQPAAPPAQPEPEPASESSDWMSDLQPLPAQEPVAEEPPAPEPLPSVPEAPAQPAEELPAPEPLPSALEAPAQPAAPASSGLSELGTSAAEQDAALLWLENLAAKQGAKSEELITDPNARLEQPPEWVEQAKAVMESHPSSPAAPEPESTQPVDVTESDLAPEPFPSLDQTGVWLREMEVKDSPLEQEPAEAKPAAWSGEIEIVPPRTGPLPASPDTDLPSWLRGFEENEPVPAASLIEDLPDWLKDEEPEQSVPPAPVTASEWKPETPKPAPSLEPEPQPEPAEPEPAARFEPIPSPMPEPEPKPEPAARLESIPQSRPEPKPEPHKPAPRRSEPKAETPAPADRSKLKRTGMLPPLVDPNLTAARDALSHGKIPDALHIYSNLIRKGKFLEDVIFDLKEALYRFPVEVSIWQALGDAYMRANRLQDALDAYTKAEELLR